MKYQVVEAEMRELIRTLPVGTRLPPERELATTYRCNFLTIRKALKQLVADGTIVRRVGSGTFVARNESQLGPRAASRLGVLVYQSGNDYAYRVLQALTRAGFEQGVDLRTAWVHNFSDEAQFQANALKNEGCLAIVLPWFPHDIPAEIRTFVRNCALPVSLPSLIPGLEDNSFEKETVYGTNKAIEDVYAYFRSLGHERIALIGPDMPDDLILQKRVTAFIRSASRENLPSPCSLVPPGSLAMDQLAERWKVYRGDLAVISYDDEHALRFMTAMHKIGLKAPDDFCILGFNDTDGSRFSDPPLTTIRQNFDYVAEWLIRNALALAGGSVCQSAHIPRLKMIVRETCGGKAKINDALRARLDDIELVMEAEETHLIPEAQVDNSLGN